MAEREKILEVRDLNISFKTDSGIVNAIRGVNLDLYKGETIAIVGESGSGKSVTTKAIMGIMAGNGSIDGGSINYTWTDENTGERITKDICQLSEKEMQSEIRGRKIAMVFQDPMTSLNPTMTIGNQIMEPMIHHYNTPKEEAYKKAVELLQLVGITNAEKRMKNYPHQLSGGMRQRIMIAMALGNIYGGKSADKSPNPDKLYGRIMIAAIWIALIPVVGKYIVLGISALLIFTVSNNFLIVAAFVACMVIFVFPLFLLGTVTPSLVKYSVDSLDDSGQTVGTLGAFNTIGSIIGTFVPTFISIPAVGTSITFLIFAGILLISLGVLK